MSQAKITREQWRAVADAVARRLSFLRRLEERLKAAGFQESDDVLRLTRAAADAAMSLRMDLHYRSCEGVGRARPEEPMSAPVSLRLCNHRGADQGGASG